MIVPGAPATGSQRLAPSGATGAARLRRGAARPGPVRTCVACRRNAPQETLDRLTLGADGRIRRDDPGQRRPGRGAYLCRERECREAALRTPSALSRAFRTHVAPADLTDLLADLAGAAHTDGGHSPADNIDAAPTAREEPTA